MPRLTEYEIRHTLTKQLKAAHRDEPDTLVIQELGVCEGRARVDIAVLNGTIHGYEIKSPDDTLARLPQQAQWYGLTFNTVTLVYSGREDAVVQSHIPDWWGMCRAERTSGACELIDVRQPLPNRGQDAYRLAQLLWREEVVELLEQRGLCKGIKSKTRDVLWRRLAESIPLYELNELVRGTLKGRVGWRVPAQSQPYVAEPISLAM
jgi:hypothetical protein